ncbi:hypothetical protein N2152v2_008716 [Parachlorella kessleri]
MTSPQPTSDTNLGELQACCYDRLGDQYLLKLVWQQRSKLLGAAAALFVCIATSLASPVLSGSCFEALLRGRPFTEYSLSLVLLLLLYAVDALLTRVYVRDFSEVIEQAQAALRKEAFSLLLQQRLEFYDKHGSAQVTALLTRELDALRTFALANVCGNRGLRACLEVSVIIISVAATHLYRRQTRVVDAAHAAAQIGAAQAAAESFAHIRTVRAYAGESQERERFACQVAAALASGLRLGQARATLEGVNRGAVHASLLCLYAFGGRLVTAGLMPVSTLVTAMSFTWALIYSTQGVLQTVADGRHALAALRRVQAVLAELPPDPWFSTDQAHEDKCSTSEAGTPCCLVCGRCGGTTASTCGWSTGGGAVGRQKAACQESTSQLGGEALPACCTGRDGSHGSGGSTGPPASAACQPCPCTQDWCSSGRSHMGETRGEREGSSAVAVASLGDLELRDCWFAYPTRPALPVLEGLSLRLARGKVTALVGRSGAGKTTVASLLQRLYAPSQGGIFLGGNDIWGFRRLDWVAALTAVTQDPVLFSGSIADNIAYGQGLGRCRQEDVEWAAKAAHAHDFISDLPEGYNTVVGERGSLLSGGQRQRIALARALLKDSPILLLDEATSALDAHSEQLVQQAVHMLMKGRTVLVIAHRLSTVKSADCIAVLQGGRIQELGSHADLVRLGGTYSQLVSSQGLTTSHSASL